MTLLFFQFLFFCLSLCSLSSVCSSLALENSIVLVQVMRVSWSREEVEFILNRTRRRCYLCRKDITWDGSSDRRNIWHIEHVIAFSENPQADILGNLLPACASCNLAKSNKDLRNFRLEEGYTVATFALVLKDLDPATRQRLQEAKDATGGNIARVDQDDELFAVLLKGASTLPTTNFYLDKPEFLEKVFIGERPLDLAVFPQVVGSGSDGEVRRGIFDTLNMAVAVKSMPLGQDLYTRKCQARELELLQFFSCKQGAFDHQIIVPFVGHFFEHGRLNIILGYAPSNLKQVLDNPLDSRVGAKFVLWAKQLCYGVSVLHKYHVLHRDIKASNVLILSSGAAVLSDFSRARNVLGSEDLTANRAGWNEFYPPLVEDFWFQAECCALSKLLFAMGRKYKDERRHLLQQFEPIFQGSVTDWPSASMMQERISSSHVALEEDIIFPAQLQYLCLRLFDDLKRAAISNVSLQKRVEDACAMCENISRSLEKLGVLALRGDTQMGKSCIVSWLLGEYSFLITTGDGNNSVTSVPVYVINSGPGSSVQMIATFMTQEEWEETVIDRFISGIELMQHPLDDEETPNEGEMRGLWMRIRHVYDLDLSFDDVFAGASWVEKMTLPPRFKSNGSLLLGQTYQVPTSGAGKSERDKFTCLEKHSFAGLVSRIDLCGPFLNIPSGIVLLDLPGSNDAVVANSMRIDKECYRDCILVSKNQWITRINEVAPATRLVDLLHEEEKSIGIFLTSFHNQDRISHRWRNIDDALRSKLLHLVGFAGAQNEEQLAIGWKRLWFYAAGSGFRGSMQELETFVKTDDAFNKMQSLITQSPLPFFFVSEHDISRAKEMLEGYAVECRKRVKQGVDEFKRLLLHLQKVDTGGGKLVQNLSSVRLGGDWFKNLIRVLEEVDCGKEATLLLDESKWKSSHGHSLRAAYQKNVKRLVHYVRPKTGLRYPLYMPGDLCVPFTKALKMFFLNTPVQLLDDELERLSASVEGHLPSQTDQLQ